MTLPWIAQRSKTSTTVMESPLCNLADARVGQDVLVLGYGRLAAPEQAHLQAYGLVAGRRVHVLQQHPVTVILIEQTELAFEKEVAREVIVKSV